MKKLEKQKFINVLNGNPYSPAPIWLMRQAGRYLKEYREIRAKHQNFLSLCYHIEDSTKVTLQPIQRFDFDAAVHFSDILVICDSFDRGLHYLENAGPKMQPIEVNDIDHLCKNFNIERQTHHLSSVYQSLAHVRDKLENSKTLIGFAGAPFTLACYMIDGSGGDFQRTLRFMKENPIPFEKLIHFLENCIYHHILNQLKNGADVIQLFDSWAGLLAHEQSLIENFVINPTKRIIERLNENMDFIGKKPYVIGFAKNIEKHIGKYIETTKISAVSLDQNCNLEQFLYNAKDTSFENIPIQGNLDPSSLLKGGNEMVDQILKILTLTKNRPHIFNLGHGVNKHTRIENVELLVQTVRNN